MQKYILTSLQSLFFHFNSLLCSCGGLVSLLPFGDVIVGTGCFYSVMQEFYVVGKLNNLNLCVLKVIFISSNYDYFSELRFNFMHRIRMSQSRRDILYFLGAK